MNSFLWKKNSLLLEKSFRTKYSNCFLFLISTAKNFQTILAFNVKQVFYLNFFV